MFVDPGAPQMQPMLGSSHYPPSFSYAQPYNHAQHTGGALLANQLASGVAGAANTGLAMGSLAASGAGLLNLASRGTTFMGLTRAPILASSLIGTAPGSGVMMGLAGGPIGIGLMAGSAAAYLAQHGIQNANMVGNIFGNMQFANAAGDPRTGRGFSQRDLMTIQRGIHNIEANNPFVSMSDALRATERFTEMGMHQGVQDAEKLAKRVTQLGKTMHEMARQLGTSMEEAGTFLRDMRGSGFYSARDVMGNTANMTLMRGFGMTSEQFAGMQRAGAGITRGSMMSGKAGAGMVTAKAAEFMQAFNSGAMSPEQAMDMTGTNTPLEAAQMLAQQTLSGTMQGLSGGLGSAMLLAAGQVDQSGKFTGKVDAGILQRMSSGGMTRDEMMRIGGLKRNTREGQMSFVARKQDITESMLESEQGQEALFGMIRSLTEQQFGPGAGDDQDAFQLVAETQFNMDRRTVRNLQKLRDTRRQRMEALAQELRTSERAAEMKENRTLGGLVTKIKGGFSDVFESATMPFSEYYRDTSQNIIDAERYLLGGGNDVIAGVSQQTIDRGIVDSMVASVQGRGGPSVNIGIGDVARLAAASGDVGSIRRALPKLTEENLRRVAAFNRERGSDVFTTLAQFVENGGDITNRSEQLRLARKFGLGLNAPGGMMTDADRDQFFALIAEQGGDLGQNLAVQANVGRLDGGTSTKDLQQLQKDMKDAMQGGFRAEDIDSYGGVGVFGMTGGGGMASIAAGSALGAAAGGLVSVGLLAVTNYNSATEDAMDRIQSGGEGTALLEKYADNQEVIDRALQGVTSDKDYEKVAENLNKRFGLNLTGADLKDVNLVLENKTGKKATQRANGGVQQKDKDDLSKAAKDLSAGVLVKKQKEALQGLVTAATATGLKLGGGDTQSQIRSAIEQLAAQNFTASSTDDVNTQILGQGVEVFKALEVAQKGGLTLEEAKTASGLSEEMLANLVTGLGGTLSDRGTIQNVDQKELNSAIAATRTQAVTISGKQEQFLNAGLSEAERQSMSIFKTAQMVDGLYEKLKTEKIITMDPEAN
jgi:hypothetical protein